MNVEKMDMVAVEDAHEVQVHINGKLVSHYTDLANDDVRVEMHTHEENP